MFSSINTWHMLNVMEHRDENETPIEIGNAYGIGFAFATEKN